jgi:hypothetical protein
MPGAGGNTRRSRRGDCRSAETAEAPREVDVTAGPDESRQHGRTSGSRLLIGRNAEVIGLIACQSSCSPGTRRLERAQQTLANRGERVGGLGGVSLVVRAQTRTTSQGKLGHRLERVLSRRGAAEDLRSSVGDLRGLVAPCPGEFGPGRILRRWDASPARRTDQPFYKALTFNCGAG